MAELSTGAKVGIGLSLAAALGVGGYLIYKSMKDAKEDAPFTAEQLAALSKLNPPAQVAALRRQNPNISDEKLMKALRELAKGLKGGSGSSGGGAPSGGSSGGKKDPTGGKKDGYDEGYGDKEGYDEGYGDKKDGYDSGYGDTGSGYGSGYGSYDSGSYESGGYDGSGYGGGYGGGVSGYEGYGY